MIKHPATGGMWKCLRLLLRGLLVGMMAIVIALPFAVMASGLIMAHASSMSTQQPIPVGLHKPQMTPTVKSDTSQQPAVPAGSDASQQQAVPAGSDASQLTPTAGSDKSQLTPIAGSDASQPQAAPAAPGGSDKSQLTPTADSNGAQPQSAPARPAEPQPIPTPASGGYQQQSVPAGSSEYQQQPALPASEKDACKNGCTQIFKSCVKTANEMDCVGIANSNKFRVSMVRCSIQFEYCVDEYIDPS